MPNKWGHYHMRATILQANQKCMEEEVPNFILESQADFREEVAFELSRGTTRSLLGWEGERQSKQRERMSNGMEAQNLMAFCFQKEHESLDGKIMGCADGSGVSGRAGMERKVRMTIAFQSSEYTDLMCGWWGVSGNFFSFFISPSLLVSHSGPHYGAAPRAPSISQSCLSRKKKICFSYSL